MRLLQSGADLAYVQTVYTIAIKMLSEAVVAFHAQQSAEKLIKAVLAARGVTFMKSHALSYLIGLVEENQDRRLAAKP
jgi:HEPN domain-containing protein